MIEHSPKAPNSALDILKDKLFRAMERLEPPILELLARRFGLNGEPPISQSELAKSMGIPLVAVIALEAEALRALIGYGQPQQKSITLEH